MPPEPAPTETLPAAPVAAGPEPVVPAAAEEEIPVIAAPRREKRVVPVAPQPKRRPVSTVRVPNQDAALLRPEPVSALENKVAALKDPAEILRVIQTEAALRRAQRLSGVGDQQRQTMRLLSVLMLFALLVAALGAMWWLQTSLQGSRRARRAPAAAPAESKPTGRDGSPSRP